MVVYASPQPFSGGRDPFVFPADWSVTYP